MTLPALLIGILISTLYGAAFHLWRGGQYLAAYPLSNPWLAGILARAVYCRAARMVGRKHRPAPSRYGDIFQRTISIRRLLAEPG